MPGSVLYILSNPYNNLKGRYYFPYVVAETTEIIGCTAGNGKLDKNLDLTFYSFCWEHTSWKVAVSPFICHIYLFESV